MIKALLFLAFLGTPTDDRSGDSPPFTGGTLSSALGVYDGTACSAPGLFIAGDTDTGIDESAANALAICAGGTNVISVTTTAITTTAVANGPNGTAAAPARTGTDTDSGCFYGTNTVSISAGGVSQMTWQSNRVATISGAALGWSSSSTDPTTASDTAWSRISAGLIGAGTGAAGSSAGAIAGTSYYAGTSATVDEAAMTTTGTVGTHAVASDGLIGFSSSSTNAVAGLDTALSRDSAGVIDVGTGAASSTAGSIKLTNLIENDVNMSRCLANVACFGTGAANSEAGSALAANFYGRAASATENSLSGTSSPPGLNLASDNSIGFNSAGTFASGSLDTNMSRLSAGVIGVGTGAQGSSAGSITAATHTATTSFVLGSGSDTTTFSEVANDASIGDFAWANTFLATGSGNGICVSPSATPTGATCENTMGVAGYVMTSDTDLNWVSSATNSATGTVDTNISRASAGLVAIGTGASGSIAGGAISTIYYAGATASTSEADMTYSGGTGVIDVASDGIIGFSSSSTNSNAGTDTAISRVSAGVVGVGTGTAGSVAGTVSAATYLVGDGSLATPSVNFNSDNDGSGGGIYRSSANNYNLVANGLQVLNWSSTNVNIRPTAASTNLFGLGTAGTQSWQFDSTNSVYGLSSVNVNGVNVTKTASIAFCGLGPNGATAVYMSPTSTLMWGGRSDGDATACATGSNATEGTAENFPMFPYDIHPVAMHCGLTDVATDTGVTFTLRAATANVGSDLICTTGALDAAGYADCTAIHGPGSAIYTVAAGVKMSMKAIAASGNESTSNMYCDLTYSY